MQKLLVSACVAVCTFNAAAQTTQTTVLRGHITAIALGPSYAAVKVNVSGPRDSGSHTVVIRKDLTAVAWPLRRSVVRVR